jgi:hypothetical protein
MIEYLCEHYSCRKCKHRPKAHEFLLFLSPSELEEIEKGKTLVNSITNDSETITITIKLDNGA